MKRIRKLVLLLMLASSTQLFSDDHVISYGMEGYQCNFAKGKDLDDVISFAQKSLNPYADQNWPVPYSSFIMTPFLRSNQNSSLSNKDYSARTLLRKNS